MLMRKIFEKTTQPDTCTSRLGRLVNFVSYTGITKGVHTKCKKRLEHYKETVSYVVTQFILKDFVGRKMKYR